MRLKNINLIDKKIVGMLLKKFTKNFNFFTFAKERAPTFNN